MIAIKCECGRGVDITEAVAKAREEGRKEGVLNFLKTTQPDVIKVAEMDATEAERERILKVIDGMQNDVARGNVVPSYQDIGFNQALEAIKEKIDN